MKRDPSSENEADEAIVPKKAKKTGPSKAAGAWTAEKRARLIEYLIVEGARLSDLDTIANELGMSKSQIQDQVKANRGNVRRTVVNFLKGETK